MHWGGPHEPTGGCCEALAKTTILCSGGPGLPDMWAQMCAKEEGVSGLLIKRNSIIPVSGCVTGWICPLLTPSAG